MPPNSSPPQLRLGLPAGGKLANSLGTAPNSPPQLRFGLPAGGKLANSPSFPEAVACMPTQPDSWTVQPERVLCNQSVHYEPGARAVRLARLVRREAMGGLDRPCEALVTV